MVLPPSKMDMDTAPYSNVDTTLKQSDASLQKCPTRHNQSSIIERFPCELRHQIFKELDEMTVFTHSIKPFSMYNGKGYIRKGPALVLALRSEPVAYHHALQFFRKSHRGVCQLTTLTGFDLSFLNTWELETFIELGLTLDGNIMKNRSALPLSNCIEWNKHTKNTRFESGAIDSLRKSLCSAKNIRKVTLKILEHSSTPAVPEWTYQVDEDLKWMFLTVFPNWLAPFSQLEKVDVYMPQTKPAKHSTYKRYESLLQGTVNRVSKAIGVVGEDKRRVVFPEDDFEDSYVDGPIAWEAPMGKHMDWTLKGLGRHFPSPVGNGTNFFDSDTHFLVLGENENGFTLSDPFNEDVTSAGRHKQWLTPAMNWYRLKAGGRVRTSLTHSTS